MTAVRFKLKPTDHQPVTITITSRANSQRQTHKNLVDWLCSIQLIHLIKQIQHKIGIVKLTLSNLANLTTEGSTITELGLTIIYFCLLILMGFKREACVTHYDVAIQFTDLNSTLSTSPFSFLAKFRLQPGSLIRFRNPLSH